MVGFNKEKLLKFLIENEYLIKNLYLDENLLIFKNRYHEFIVKEKLEDFYYFKTIGDIIDKEIVTFNNLSMIDKKLIQNKVYRKSLIDMLTVEASSNKDDYSKIKFTHNRGTK